MQVSVEQAEGLQRRLTIGVPAEEVDAEVEKRLKDAAKKVRLDGFRVGKVPFKIVKQRFGDSVRQEVLGDVINRTYFEAVEQENIQPAGMPSIDTTKNSEGEDLEYTATVEVYPELELTDFSQLEIEKPVATVEEADVDKMIERLRDQQATWEPVERAAQMGDQVTIDYRGTKDGEAFEGGTAENQKLELGSNSMIPGFEDGIVGMKAGDEKVLNLTFPEDYHAEELKGAAVEFNVKVHEVAEKKLPELNAEFFAKFGVESDDESAFREEVKNNMERELNRASKAKVREAVMDALHGAQEVDLPQALIARETENLRKQMLQQFGGQIPENFDAQSLLPDSMFEEQAKKRVALGLIVNEIIQQEELTADPDKVKEAIQELAATYHEPQAVEQYYSTNQEARASIEAMVLEEVVVEHILSKAKVTEKPSDYDEVVQPQGA